MAKIWPVYEGKRPTIGGPWADIPLSEAIQNFELQPGDFISEATSAPRFADRDRDLSLAGFKRIVVEIEPDEGKRAKWKPGLYGSRIRPDEGYRRLIEQPFVAALGKANVVRVEYAPATDSRGRDALKVIVVIAPDAVKRLAGGSVLDALVRLRERLSEMRDDRTPIVEYATEAELLEDGGPQS
jgi:hypothetical protein